MNTCKDCIHYTICQYHITEETALTVNECSHGFKHKGQYIKLPAYIGQRVWVARAWRHYSGVIHSEVIEGSVSMLQQKVDGSWKIRVSARYVADYAVEEFNKEVFLTEEAAEAKRIELIKKLKTEVN